MKEDMQPSSGEHASEAIDRAIVQAFPYQTPCQAHDRNSLPQAPKFATACYACLREAPSDTDSSNDARNRNTGVP